MKIGFVFTNYGNAAYTRAAIASLHASGAPEGVRIAVVDNASAPDQVAMLRETAREYPIAEVLAQRENLGYFPGLNVGIRHLRAREPDLLHMVVGNNDVEFPRAFVDTLRAHRGVFDEWAVVAPDLVGPDGQHQNPHVLRPITRLRKLVWDVYFSSYAAAAAVRWMAGASRRLTRRAENDPSSTFHRTAGPIEQGYGACYILGPVFFRHFAQLCAPTFLMQEEFFLYEQLRTIGQLTYYDPRFTVRHHHHATMGQLPGRRHWGLSRDAHRVYKRYLAMPAAERRAFVAAHAEAVP